MKSILGLVQGAACRVDLEFKDSEGRPYKKTATVKLKSETEELPLYTNKDDIYGEIRVTPLTTKKIEHQGIRVQLIGQIELAAERGSPHDFVSLVRELAPSGDLSTSKTYPFDFRNVEMQYDSYRGQQVRCRYLLRVSVTGKGMTTDSKRDFPIWVRNYEKLHQAAEPIKMEVGIEDCLHIEFEYDKAKYHLRDVVVGKINFLLVRIKLKHMEVEIRRRETAGVGTSGHHETETIAKYEIMDGAPVRLESIPIRLYLSPYDLTPTYVDVHNKYSVKYFLNLVLVDEEDRRYFKQQEITLYRKLDDGTPAQHAVAPFLQSPAPAAMQAQAYDQGPGAYTQQAYAAPSTSYEQLQGQAYGASGAASPAAIGQYAAAPSSAAAGPYASAATPLSFPGTASGSQGGAVDSAAGLMGTAPALATAAAPATEPFPLSPSPAAIADTSSPLPVAAPAPAAAAAAEPSLSPLGDVPSTAAKESVDTNNNLLANGSAAGVPLPPFAD